MAGAEDKPEEQNMEYPPQDGLGRAAADARADSPRSTDNWRELDVSQVVESGPQRRKKKKNSDTRHSNAASGARRPAK